MKDFENNRIQERVKDVTQRAIKEINFLMAQNQVKKAEKIRSLLNEMQDRLLAENVSNETLIKKISSVEKEIERFALEER